MAAFLDLCRFIPTLGGTSDFIYSSAVGGCQSPSVAGAQNGVKYKCYAVSSDLTQWEIFEGAYNSSTGTFPRTTVLYNSSGTGTAAGQSGAGTKINFSTVPQVAIVGIAEDLISVEVANSFTATQQARARSNIGAATGGDVNKLRNGAFDVWQRGGVVVTTAGGYTADGWIVAPTGASVTVNQAGNGRTGAFTLLALQVIGATSVTDVQVAQRIESYVAAPLAGQTVTVQFQIYNNTGVSFTPTLTTRYPSAQDNWSSPTTDLAATNLQTCPAGQWTQVSYTLSVSTGAVRGYAFILDLGNNFSTNTKTACIAEADVRVTPGVATGLNSNPPPPEMRPIFAEMPFCTRYYQIGAGEIMGASNTSSSTMVPLCWNMRTTPTVSGSSTNIQNTSAGFPAALSATGGYFYVPSSASNVTVQASFTYTASAEL